MNTETLRTLAEAAKASWVAQQSLGKTSLSVVLGFKWADE